jgi:rhodanese-related sulfurtransferase
MKDEVTVQELSEILKKDPSAVLIDVRGEDEYNEVNLAGKLIPLNELEDRYQEIPQDKPVYLYCRSGRRSRTALDFLKSKGYANCFNVGGGILAWLNEVDPDGRAG